MPNKVIETLNLDGGPITGTEISSTKRALDVSIGGTYNPSAGSSNTTETNPIWNQNLGETIVDVTNETDGTNEYYVDMDGYAGLNLQLIISGGSGTMTVTVEASAQDDGTAAASVTYIDVTSDVFGSASFTASTYLFDSAKVLGGAKFVKVKTVSSTGGSNDADVRINIKKLY